MTKEEKKGGKKYFGNYRMVIPGEYKRDKIGCIRFALNDLLDKISENVNPDYDTIRFAVREEFGKLCVAIKYEGWYMDGNQMDK